METESGLVKCEVARQPNRRDLKRMQAQAKRDRKMAEMREKEKQEFLLRPVYNGKILSIKKTPCYLIVKEMTGNDWGKPFPIEYAVTPSGDYLGDVKMAYRLVNKYGISVFEKTDVMHSVCSIGYNLAKKLWYGWSHRAIYGYKRKRDAVRFAASVS